MESSAYVLQPGEGRSIDHVQRECRPLLEDWFVRRHAQRLEALREDADS